MAWLTTCSVDLHRQNPNCLGKRKLLLSRKVEITLSKYLSKILCKVGRRVIGLKSSSVTALRPDFGINTTIPSFH